MLRMSRNLYNFHDEAETGSRGSPAGRSRLQDHPSAWAFPLEPPRPAFAPPGPRQRGRRVPLHRTIKTMAIEGFAPQLLTLLARTSFKLGQFTLSSGGASDYYIDCRTTTLHAEGGRLTGHAILDLLAAKDIDAEAVGGLTMGADPIVSNVATASAWRAVEHPGAPLLHGFLVRKAEKAHGTGRRIEGFCRPGARVVIVDDVCTTGASTVAAIAAAQEAGMTVAAVVCIVEREEAHGRPAVEAAAKPAPFLRLFSAVEVRAAHLTQRVASVSSPAAV